MTLEEVLEAYSDGWLPRSECVSRLIDLANHVVPPEIEAALPSDFVMEIRSEIVHLPLHPDDIVFAHGHTPKVSENEANQAATLRLAQQRRHRALYHWHAHFESAHKFAASDGE